MPQFLVETYWRMHANRTLKFRCATKSVRFTETPDRGIPQGSPESPMVYAAVVEDTLNHTLEVLKKQAKPCGVLLS